MQPAADTLVVDASVAAKWHLAREPLEVQALLLLDQFTQGKTELWAPSCIRTEVPSAITVATRGQNPRITRQQGEEAIEEFLSISLNTVLDAGLVLPAFFLVHEHGCAFYDALYLALAEKIGGSFITADQKLYLRVRRLQYVVWLGDYPLSTNG